MCENFSYHYSIGRFKTGAWNKHGRKVEFLPGELLTELAGLFEQINDMNDRIDAARRQKSNSYMAAIEVDKLKPPLARCQEQLKEWVMENMNNPDYLPKKRSLFRR